MIRRGSYLNTLNSSLHNFAIFNESKRIFLFKSSVSLKRYNAGITKFKRKSAARRKHYSNWFVYLNTLSKWTSDFKIQKQLIKFQYLNKILLTNAFCYNFKHIKPDFLFENKNPSESLFLFTTLSKKIYSYLHPYRHFYHILKFFNIAYTFTTAINFQNTPVHLIPVTPEYDAQFFCIQFDNFTINNSSFHLDYLLIAKVTEFYKIFIFFIYYCIIRC